jgi:hypothetical protein
MDAPVDLDNLAIDTTAVDQRSCLQHSGAAPETKASFKSIERALRPNNHLPANTANSSGAKTLHKALSRLSATDDDFANIDVAREELENGEETKEGEDELEDALRALESYAAFQVTLVRHMESNPTFNVSPQQFLSPTSSGKGIFDSGRLSEDSLWDSSGGVMHLDQYRI